ncbi:MAG: 4Fe-4S binding protein [Candidatus Omnitrophica bacterium]|nr:4Fe-4S binding protein [Candidatus Omnitrophota bacterium]
MEQNTRQVIFTNEARCRDCYRCVRVCPIKAIKVEGNQARVHDERCIACGTCVRECPQGAKTYRKDVGVADEILKSGVFVAASIAPAFAGVFEEWEYFRLPAALRRLGFRYVAETAIGAYMVARDTAVAVKDGARPHICTACPAVVNYVEKYEKDKVPYLVPIVSPMMAHARHIKARMGMTAKVIFIGPCAAKKTEAERPQLKGLIDCVLTFEELEQLFEERGIDLGTCEESSFDEEPLGLARLFPVEGGAAATSQMCTDVLDDRLMFVSGFEEFKECLKSVGGKGKAPVIEPLLCPQGCVNGPGIRREGNPFERRSRVIRYARGRKPVDGPEPAVLDLTTSFQSRPVLGDVAISEEQVRTVLEKAGKARLEQQLNCGACGYPTCRDQAVAVVRGMAGIEMCIPFMRRLAEQRSDRIMETSPNGIVVLDQHLNILNFNPAFSTMFKVGPSIVGEHISRLLDPDPFEKVASGQLEIADDPREYPQYGVVLREVVYALRAEHQYVGMFINITSREETTERLRKVKDETVTQAKELHAHQIEMAKNFANFLGEYTAKGEQLVNKLLEAVNDKDKEKG